MTFSNSDTNRPSLPFPPRAIDRFVSEVDIDLTAIEDEARWTKIDPNPHGQLNYKPFGIAIDDLNDFAEVLEEEGKTVTIKRLPRFLYRFIPVASFTVHY